jgi:hypothetical protein
MLRLLDRFRRYHWVDWVLTRLEAYGALLEQWGIRPSVRTVIDLVVALVLAVWTVASESWLPVGIAIGLVVFVVLTGFRRQPANPHIAAAAEPKVSSPAESPASAGQLVAKIDFNRLTEFAVYLSAAHMLDWLLKQAPEGFKAALDLRDDLAAKNEVAGEFLDLVRRKMDPGSYRRSNFEGAMAHAENDANHQVEQTPPNERPENIDHLALRRHAIKYAQCAQAIRFLMKEKREIDDSLLAQRGALLEMYRARANS